MCKLLLAAALLLSACSGSGTVTSRAATDIQIIAAGLGPVVTALATTPGVNPATVAQAQKDLAILQEDAKAIAASTSTQGTIAQEVNATVQALAGIAGTIPALASYAPVIQAAAALLPVILTEAGVNVAGIHPATMSPDEARGILLTVAR